jgi:small basic protein
MMLKIVGLTVGILAILVAAAVAPDIKRYIKISSM